MANISLTATGGRIWLSDHTPGVSEPTAEGSIDLYDSLIVTTTNKLYINTDNTPGALTWAPYFNSNLNTTRSYSSVSLAFNTSRTPNSTKDVFVTCSVQLITTLLNSEKVEFQVDSGSGFSTVTSIEQVNLVNTTTYSASFIVPANTSYKIISSGAGTSSIVSIFELTL